MTYEEKAAEMHEKKYNCAQCVLASLGDLTGLDEKTALSVAAGFGGGMRTGEVCGAVTGALMALGMTKAPEGQGGKTDPVADYGKRLQKQFKAEYGSLRCAALIKGNQGRKRCDEFIARSVRLAAELIAEPTELPRPAGAEGEGVPDADSENKTILI